MHQGVPVLACRDPCQQKERFVERLEVGFPIEVVAAFDWTKEYDTGKTIAQHYNDDHTHSVETLKGKKSTREEILPSSNG